MAGDSYVELLCPYLDGELSQKESRELEAHLARCAACRNELESLSNLVSDINGLPALQAPPALLEGVRAGLAGGGLAGSSTGPRRARVGWGRHVRRALAVAAGVLLAVWIGQAQLPTPHQSPREQATADSEQRQGEASPTAEDRPEPEAVKELGDNAAPESSAPPSPPRDGVVGGSSGRDDSQDMPERERGFRAPGARPGSAAAEPEADGGLEANDGVPARATGVDDLIAELTGSIEGTNSLLAEVPVEQMPELLTRLEQLRGVELDLKDLRRGRGGPAEKVRAESEEADDEDWLFGTAHAPRNAAGSPAPAPVGAASRRELSLDSSVVTLFADRLAFQGDTVGITEVRWLLRLLEVPSHDNRRQILFLWERVDPAIDAAEREAAAAYTRERLQMLESRD